MERGTPFVSRSRLIYRREANVLKYPGTINIFRESIKIIREFIRIIFYYCVAVRSLGLIYRRNAVYPEEMFINHTQNIREL